jgi:hypothetical protein
MGVLKMEWPRCPKCGIKVIIERGYCFRLPEEEAEVERGDAVRIVQGCCAQDWTNDVICPNCGTKLLEKEDKLIEVPQIKKASLKKVNCPKCSNYIYLNTVKMPGFTICKKCKSILWCEKNKCKVVTEKELFELRAKAREKKKPK